MLGHGLDENLVENTTESSQKEGQVFFWEIKGEP